MINFVETFFLVASVSATLGNCEPGRALLLFDRFLRKSNMLSLTRNFVESFLFAFDNDVLAGFYRFFAFSVDLVLLEFRQ